MKMNVPAEVIFAEGQIVFRARVDDVIEGVESEGFGFAELGLKFGIFDAAAKSPDGVNERELCEFEPGGAKVEDFVLWIGSEEIDSGVADEKDVVEVVSLFVAGKWDEFGIKAAFGEENF